MVGKNETFRCLGLGFRVYPLWLYAQRNLEPCRIKLNRLVKFYGFNAIESKDKMSMFKINAEYAMNLKAKDYRQPILIVKLGEETGGLIIDGLHRAYKLWRKGQKTIRAYYIDDKSVLEKHSNIKIFNLQ